MSELRKDYILDRWVYIASGRRKRPHQVEETKHPKKDSECFFCPGNEHMTPPEIGRLPVKGVWRIRWFENKFPAVRMEGSPASRTDNRFYTFAPGYGHHEVIVETPDHSKQLADLPVDDVAELLRVYAGRISDIGRMRGIEYVQVLKNYGPLAGTSVVHSHSQVIGISRLPKSILEECAAVRKFIECPYCQIVESERKSVRLCFENEDVVAFCPYAAKYNYEVWLFPKNHITSFSDIPFISFAGILKKVLQKLHSIKDISYNYVLHYSPYGDLHVHVEVYPKIQIFGGFERGSGMIINNVSPEESAAFYRGEE